MSEHTKEFLPDNVGEVGLTSIRIGGMKIQDLGFVEMAHVKQQIPLMLDTERKNRIEDLISKFPHHRVDYLQSKIKESKENIVRVRDMIDEQKKLITDYQKEIALCNFRDNEISRINGDLSLGSDEKREQVKALKKKFPPYDVQAMKQQIIQSGEAIDRGEQVINREAVDIEQHAHLLGMCEIRDEEFKKLGVTITAGNI